MKLFSNVTRYVCLYCKKDFKSNTRHDCKRDPDKKNCFTCKHNKGWKPTEVEYDYHNSEEWGVICENEYDHTAPDLVRMSYKLNCPEWELKEDES